MDNNETVSEQLERQCRPPDVKAIVEAFEEYYQESDGDHLRLVSTADMMEALEEIIDATHNQGPLVQVARRVLRKLYEEAALNWDAKR